jgi:hypothetical protein
VVSGHWFVIAEPNRPQSKKEKVRTSEPDIDGTYKFYCATNGGNYLQNCANFFTNGIRRLQRVCARRVLTAVEIVRSRAVLNGVSSLACFRWGV